jgi:hypothetical protein
LECGGLRRFLSFLQARKNKKSGGDRRTPKGGGRNSGRKMSTQPQESEDYKPGSFGCHELLDRTNLVADNLEEWILSHPACVQNAEWYALADRAVTALRELYQRIGAEHLEAERDADEKRG